MSAIEPMIEKRQSLLRSTSLVSLMTLLSRVLGFVRDMVLAGLFGAEAGMDAFIVAFRIPNFMRRLFAEGAFSQAFVPVLAEYQKLRSADDVRTFVARIFGCLGAVLSLVTVIGVLASPVIIFLFAPGFENDAGRATLASSMLRITFPYLMLISLTAMMGAVLNTWGYFGVPAFTPALLNVSMIGAALWLAPWCSPPVRALAWGVLIAGIAQLLFQIPFLLKQRLLPRPEVHWRDPGVRRVLKLMVPALFGVSIAQLNLMVDSIFASFLQIGSVSWLYYTDRVTDFPLGVFGVAIATVILPHLSRKNAEQNREQFSRALDWGMRLLLLIGLPSAIGLTLFSMPMVAGFFAYGAFNTVDVLQTQKSTIALSVGIPAFMMVKVLASGFYACQDIRTPVKVGIWAMVVNTILCALLVGFLQHAGLALASALAGYVNCVCLLVLLKRRKIYQPMPGWGRFLLQLLSGALVLCAWLWFRVGDVSQWVSMHMGHRLFMLVADIAAGALLYLATLWLMGMRPAQFRGQVRES
ncbi:integral membrane protein [Legionella geestiana]|uniref:Probable lipid II flippase MurJ n=1 Tax=Legionella geestiana TaxID=45065 RepID=A0A0W0TXH6_9GAMM|nr:murein biosynthesis integral membrane protein MurJ [Legionella geestiana]KTD00175.1 integral membrane protein [Legionella geestiana]QBS11782.1 murein biosynthesis integral membrane protein MurJ [Legionella geestiana]QDQ40604.1 murein biosynthesis integral membrane protein MurJ [Legionella geestiana]STX53526.1 integral membrane protein [Legionella geestiana]